MYHRVARTDVDPWGLCVSSANFAAQLEAIRRVAEPLPLLDLVRNQTDGPLPSRSVVVTFDDGYVDNLEQALPVLREHGVPATLFIATGNIDTPPSSGGTGSSLLLALGRLPATWCSRCRAAPALAARRGHEYTREQCWRTAGPGLVGRGGQSAASVPRRLGRPVAVGCRPRQVALDAVADWAGSALSADPGSAEDFELC